MSAGQRSSLPQKLALLDARMKDSDTGDGAIRSVVWEFLSRAHFDRVKVLNGSRDRLEHRNSVTSSQEFEFMLRMMREGHPSLRRRASPPWQRAMVQRVEQTHQVYVVSTLVHFESEALLMGTVTGELFCAPPPPLPGNTPVDETPILLARGLGCCDGLYDVSHDGTIRAFSRSKGWCRDLMPVQ
ncbi:hypothetical protein FOZ62_010955 [Perkinsus olseni]|uniref:Uncharacterized protein n=1 Tax=Perkinsus olseni TaxID=32597 RepID=A0A7J6U1L0_PEROL|nr:hypothetical protein FOZ62_010955 [Perkinsus olseni]